MENTVFVGNIWLFVHNLMCKAISKTTGIAVEKKREKTVLFDVSFFTCFTQVLQTLSFVFPWEKVENKKYAKTFFQSTACFAKCENQEQENLESVRIQ